ncbi:MAG: Chitinase, partial [Akkermansiaceae bacterium]|nr:Chitinase [Akkermansiaceae bacterium]
AFTTGDGGLLEISKDNGTTWLDIGATGSGATFTQGAYDGKIPSGTNNPAAGRSGWLSSTGSYFQSVISLDSTVWAGKNLKFRWRLATNSSTASPGAWSIDDLNLNGKLVTLSYADWAAIHFTDLEAFSSQEDGDADGDGLTNFAEYAMGSDPNAKTPQPVSVKNSDGSITINFTKAINTEGVIYHAEISPDLINWTDVTMTSLGSPADNPLIQNMKATLPAPSGKSPNFLRVRFAR